jgi:outer membrane protein
VAHRQIAIDSAQVVRLEAFLKNGKASPAEVSQQQSTLAQARLTATQADNNLQLSILALTQLLELPSPEGFSVVRPSLATTLGSSLMGISPDAIYQEALTLKPEVQAEQLRLTASERNINIAKAALYPTLNFSAGLQSNYYKTNGMQADPFATQMKNNFSQYIGFNLNVPIFSRFQTRNSIRSARIDRDNQLLQLESVKKTLYKEIQQVYYNTLNAQQKERSSRETVRSSNDAFTLMLAKYENGKANITEFNEAKNVYLKAESDRVQALYELLYQHALINFYQGRELSF